MWATGSNEYGQLGLDSKRNPMKTNFVKVFKSGAKALSTGDGHSLLLRHDGSVWSTGSNTYGQLGDGSNSDRDSFVQVIPSYAEAIAAGAQHSLVVMHDGSVWATGLNMQGQLGDGTTIHKSIFVQVIIIILVIIICIYRS